MSYEKLSAVYFDSSTRPEEQTVFFKILASFLPSQVAEFPYVRTLPLQAEVKDGHLFHVLIPGILEMVVDRNWGQEEPPLPEVAAVDRFANTLRYAQNLRYWMRDEAAHLNFDYSRRQANYRVVDLDAADYRKQSMLVQFQDRSGSFSAAQLRLISEQHLTLPDLKSIRENVAHLRQESGRQR